jgi:hypothetical protein
MSDYFIITAGPTGSGKTKLVDETLKVLGIQGHPVKKYLIDDYVEGNSGYKERIKKIIKEVENECKEKGNSVNECVKQAYDNPTSELFEKFKLAYFEARTHGCMERGSVGCNTVLNQNLKNLSKNSSLSKVAVFETTGMSIPEWLLRDATYVPAHAKIIMAYSLVGLRELVKRNKSRAYQSILEFQANHSKSAPRLPNVSESTFRGIVSRIREVLLDLYKSCMLQRNVNCGQRPIHQLVLFDNNGPSHKLIFNSMDEHQQSLSLSEFEQIVNQSLYDKMGGGKKRKTRGRRRPRTRKTRSSM